MQAIDYYPVAPPFLRRPIHGETCGHHRQAKTSVPPANLG
jgi:hypothetical protein